jgi:hypothetical protein
MTISSPYRTADSLGNIVSEHSVVGLQQVGRIALGLFCLLVAVDCVWLGMWPRLGRILYHGNHCPRVFLAFMGRVFAIRKSSASTRRMPRIWFAHLYRRATPGRTLRRRDIRGRRALASARRGVTWRRSLVARRRARKTYRIALATGPTGRTWANHSEHDLRKAAVGERGAHFEGRRSPIWTPGFGCTRAIRRWGNIAP